MGTGLKQNCSVFPVLKIIIYPLILFPPLILTLLFFSTSLISFLFLFTSFPFCSLFVSRMLLLQRVDLTPSSLGRVFLLGASGGRYAGLSLRQPGLLWYNIDMCFIVFLSTFWKTYIFSSKKLGKVWRLFVKAVPLHSLFRTTAHA